MGRYMWICRWKYLVIYQMMLGMVLFPKRGRRTPQVTWSLMSLSRT